MAKKIASLYADIGAKTDNFEKGAKSVKKDLTGMKSSFHDIGLASIGAFTSIGAVAAGAAKVIKDSTLAASDLEESYSKVGVVFGSNADVVRDWAKTTSDSIGISQQAALEAAGTYGNLFTALGMAQKEAAGMSTELVQLAADLASFNNQNPEDVLLALRSGLSGEVEPLKRFGIAMNEATMKAKAMELGLGDNLKALSEAEKVQVRYAIILDQTATAQGDFARTAEGLANSTRKLNAGVDDLQANLGEAFIPAAKEGTNVLSDLVSSLNAGFEETNLLNDAMRATGMTNADFVKAARNAGLSVLEYAKSVTQATGDTSSFDRAMMHLPYTMADVNSELEDTKEQLKQMTKYNQEWLSSIEGVTKEQENYHDKMRDLTTSYADEVAKLDELTKTRWWDVDAINEQQDKIDDLRVTMQEEADEFELNTRRRILAMIEEQLAADGLTLAETAYLQELGLQWGIYTESAVTAMQEAQTQAQLFADFFNNLPDEKVMTLRLETRGFDQSIAGFAAENTIRAQSDRGRASGGPVWPGASFLVGENGPEIFTPSQSGNITPNGGGGAGMFSQSDIEALTSAFTTALMRAG